MISESRRTTFSLHFRNMFEDELNTSHCPLLQDSRKKVHFTDEEKRFLSQLVQSKRHVIESKKVDAQSLVNKKAEWEIITTQFNSVSSHYKRTMKQLQKAWENLKFRKKIESEKKENLKKLKDLKNQVFINGIHDNAKDETFMDNILVPSVTIKEEFATDFKEQDLHNNSNTGLEDKAPSRKKRKTTTDASSQTDPGHDCMTTIYAYKLEEAKCRLHIAQEELAQLKERFQIERDYLREKRDTESRMLKREN